jgi:hypothetical protein
MKLRDWFILVAAILFWALWTDYAYRRGADSAFQECGFDA